MSVRVRFAPSPTGYLHIGGARTALFNWLFAKANGGDFILRIEDTDQTRYVEDAEKEIYESLKWLGMDWNEGVDKGGDYGPYRQSERLEIYQQEINRLIESGHAYRCFCSVERLQKLREEQQKQKNPAFTGYDRHCRDLSAEEIESNLKEGKPHVVRLKIPDSREISFEDMVRGSIEYKSEVLDDLVLMKTDGFPTYHLANVVDDHAMKISHVLRGDEWISSTPRHILLYEALGWEPPHFAHMPVILAPGGGKLSKRSGAASVMDYKKAGYLPEALVNFLSLLGWAPGDDREIMNVADIIAAFSLDRVSPKPSVFDEQKLEWMNGHYMAEKDTAVLLPAVTAIWKEKGFITGEEDGEYLQKIVDVMKGRSKKITDLAENTGYFFHDPAEYEPKAVKKRFKEGVELVLNELVTRLEGTAGFSQKELEEVYQRYADESGLSGGKLIHPTRLAISGVSFGPGLFELMELLGKDAVIRRMKKAIKWLEERK